MKNNLIGSISHGTMRPEDLIPAFVDCADKLRLTRHQRVRLRRIQHDMKIAGYYTNEAADYDLNEVLVTILDEYAPPFFYFGSHPGDGADYGFWLCDDWERMLEDDGGIKVNDLSEVPKNHFGYVAVVNDHGNVTLYNRHTNHRIYEVWSVV